MYFEGLILGVIGIPIGIQAGILGIGLTLSLINPLLEVFQGNASETFRLHVPVSVVLASGLLAALTIFISLLKPARRASKVTPIGAIRLSDDVKLRRKDIRTSGLVRKLFGFEAEIALKNLRRSKRKFRTTIISLSISLILFLTVSFFIQTFTQNRSYLIDGTNYDIALFPRGFSAAETTQFIETVRAVPEVEDLGVIRSTYAELEVSADQLSPIAEPYLGQNSRYLVEIRSLDEQAFEQYVDQLELDASLMQLSDQARIIIVNFGQARTDQYLSGEVFNFREGTQLPLMLGEAKTTVEVAKMTDRRPMGVDIGHLTQPQVIVSEAVFEGLTAGVDSELIETGLYLNSPSALTLGDTLRQLIQDFEVQDDGRVSMRNVAKQRIEDRNFNLIVNVFIYGFLVLISLISVANIFNTVSTNVQLRRREFAMLRSVGLTPGGFNRLIRFESLFYGIFSLSLGIPVSIGLSFLLYKIQSELLSGSFQLPWRSYLIAILLIFLVVGLTMLYSASRIKKENIIEPLKADS